MMIRGYVGDAAMTPAGYRMGLACVFASAVAWSTAGLFTRLIPLDTWTLLAWRGIFGALGIACLMLVGRGRQSWRELATMGGPGWMFVAVSALGMVLFIAALRLTTVAHVAVIYATVPLVGAGLGWLAMRERPGGAAMLASAVAMAGVLLMVGWGREGHLSGDALAFGMTVCMAGMMVLVRRHRSIPTLPATGLSALLSAVVCWPLGDPLTVSGAQFTLLASFGIVNAALGMALFVFGARLLPVLETALIGALDAPLAPLWVWIVVGETPDGTTLAGAWVVFSAVAVYLVHAALGVPRPANASVARE